MENKVYIGINGVGKSKELQQINSETNNSILIRYSEKENAPDSNVIDKSNRAINQFKAFIDNLFSFNATVPLKTLSKEDRDNFNDILKRIKSDADLEEIWKRITSDPNLNFLKDKKVAKIINSNKDEMAPVKFDISQKLYEFNFSNWKTSTSKGITTYGTGKLVYFQIKFIYEFLDLIGDNKQDMYLLIDEPELFLHPSMQKQVGYMLKKIGEKINVIIATHSSTFLNSFYKPKNTQIYSKKSHAGKWREIALDNIFAFSSRKTCFEVLMASKVIIVEGSNDIKLLEHVINNQDKINQDIAILIANGKDKIPSRFSIVSKLEDKKGKTIFDKKDIFILYDIDSSIKKSKESSQCKKNGHEKWNSDIKKLETNKYGFLEDLEEYFDVEGSKEKWNPDAFFSKQENKKKLHEFLKKSELMNFLGMKDNGM